MDDNERELEDLKQDYKELHNEVMSLREQVRQHDVRSNR